MTPIEDNFRWLELEINNLSCGPDQQLQRRQRVYRQLGVQQALVLVQINRNVFVFYKSLLKILDPSGHLLTLINLLTSYILS